MLAYDWRRASWERLDADGTWVYVVSLNGNRAETTLIDLDRLNSSQEPAWSWDASTGRWVAYVDIGQLGHTQVVIVSRWPAAFRDCGDAEWLARIEADR